MVERVVWVDASAGAGGDLLLGALVDAGVPIGVLAEAIEKVATGARLHEERVQRGDVAATCCRVEVEDLEDQRTWRDVEALLAGAGLHEDVRSLAHDVFARLAEDRGHAQGLPTDQVDFQDEGSPLAIAEVVGVCAGVVHLGPRLLVISPGAEDLDPRSPIGAALLMALADDWGPEPAMSVSAVGVGAASGAADGSVPLLRLSVGDSDPESIESLGES